MQYKWEDTITVEILTLELLSSVINNPTYKYKSFSQSFSKLLRYHRPGFEWWLQWICSQTFHLYVQTLCTMVNFECIALDLNLYETWLEVSSLSSAPISKVSNHWKTTTRLLVAFPLFKKTVVADKESWAVPTESRAKQPQWVPQTHWLVWGLEATCMHKPEGSNTEVTQLPFLYYGLKGKPCMCQRDKDGCG